MEIWKDIKGYEGYYQVSNMGRIKSLPRKIYNSGILGKNKFYITKEKILKGRLDKKGYLRVVLCKNNKKKDYLIHRLTIEAFKKNVDNKPCINHIDGNKTNNKLDNLEWCTYSENLTHAYKMNLKKRIRNIETYCIRLTKYNTFRVVIEGKEYGYFKTYKEAKQKRDKILLEKGGNFGTFHVE